MASYDLILKKKNKSLILNIASIKGDQGKPLGISKIETLSDRNIKLTFDDEKSTSIIIPHGRDAVLSFTDFTDSDRKQFEDFVYNDFKERLDRASEIATLAHLADTGKDLIESSGKLLRADREVGVRVKNGGHTFTIPETVKKARVYFKAQCEEATFDNYLFFWVGDGTEEDKRFVSELENRTRHYSFIADLSTSHEIVISTVQAWDMYVKIWDIDWKEVL